MVTDQAARRRHLVEALRSGRFKQTVNALCRVDVGHCCLGVACEVAIEDGLELERFQIEGDPLVSFGGLTGSLPKSVRDWYGFRSRVGAFGVVADCGTLTVLNDIGTPFEEIARFIESEPPGLFVS